MIEQILMDVDGVVADFVSAALRKFDKDPGTFIYPPGIYSLERVLDKPSAALWAILDTPEFWERDIEPYPKALQFIQTAREIAPLAFCTRPYRNPDGAASKIRWLHKHFGKDLPIYLCYEGGKAVFANRRTLLVDDLPTNITEFQVAGGKGLLVPRPWNTKEPQPLARIDYTSLISEMVHA